MTSQILDYHPTQYQNYNLSQRMLLNSCYSLIYQLLEFEVRITVHQTPSIIYSAIRSILTCYLELYDRKILLAHRIFWQSQLVNSSNLTPNQVARWNLYYIMPVLTRIIIQHDVFSMDITRMYFQWTLQGCILRLRFTSRCNLHHIDG